MVDIHKGQYFKGQNDRDYIFLSYKNPNIIYCVKEDFETSGLVLLFESEFIESPLLKYNDFVKNINWYYQWDVEFENTNLAEKLDTLITNTRNDFKKWEDEVRFLRLDIRIKKISDLVKGKAFFSDQNQYYEVIGFLVETETYEGKKKTEDNKGLFAIYHSKCDNLAPMTFFYNDSSDTNKFYNKGTNDYCIIEEILMKEDDINKYIREHKYNVPNLANKDTVIGMGK